jgi:hypothetical protein
VEGVRDVSFALVILWRPLCCLRLSLAASDVTTTSTGSACCKSLVEGGRWRRRAVSRKTSWRGLFPPFLTTECSGTNDLQRPGFDLLSNFWTGTTTKQAPSILSSIAFHEVPDDSPSPPPNLSSSSIPPLAQGQVPSLLTPVTPTRIFGVKEFQWVRLQVL